MKVAGVSESYQKEPYRSNLVTATSGRKPTSSTWNKGKSGSRVNRLWRAAQSHRMKTAATRRKIRRGSRKRNKRLLALSSSLIARVVTVRRLFWYAKTTFIMLCLLRWSCAQPTTLRSSELRTESWGLRPMRGIWRRRAAESTTNLSSWTSTCQYLMDLALQSWYSRLTRHWASSLPTHTFSILWSSQWPPTRTNKLWADAWLPDSMASSTSQ